MQYLGTSSKRATHFLKKGWNTALPYTDLASARLQASRHTFHDGGEPIVLAVDDAASSYNFLSPAHLKVFEVDRRPLIKRVGFDTELAGVFTGILKGIDTVQKNVVNAIQVGQGEKDAGISQTVHNLSESVEERQKRVKESAARSKGKMAAIQYYSANPLPTVKPQNPYPEKETRNGVNEHGAWADGWSDGKDEVRTKQQAQKINAKNASVAKPKTTRRRHAARPGIRPVNTAPASKPSNPTGPKPVNTAPAPKPVNITPPPPAAPPAPMKPRKPKAMSGPSKPRLATAAVKVPTLKDIKRSKFDEAQKMSKLDHYVKQVQLIHGQLRLLHKDNLAKLAQMLKIKPNEKSVRT